MDAASFGLLARLAESQIGRLRKLLKELPAAERGSTYTTFVSIHLDAIEAIVLSIVAAYGTTTSDPERALLGRKLYRLKVFVDSIHGNAVEHRSDIGRRDLPVGLLHLIDALIEDLLKASADPVVHLDQQYMYSTLRMADQWQRLSGELGVTWTEPTEPIIFNLPGLDPANALLSPILAHEVGHSVINRHDLVVEVDQRLDVGAVDDLKDEYSATPGADVSDAMEQFGRWVEELLCDALALELTGPGLLLASAAFLPASSAGQSGPDHPDPAQRLTLSLEQLTRNGWIGHLDGSCPAVMDWLRAKAGTSPAMLSPREKFLRRLVDLATDPIIDVAKSYVDGNQLTWTVYEEQASEIGQLLNSGIPPAVIDGEPVSPWVIIAAFWLYALTVHGDSSEALAAGIDDEVLAGFALKTVEMSRVLELWKAADAAAT